MVYVIDSQVESELRRRDEMIAALELRLDEAGDRAWRAEVACREVEAALVAAIRGRTAAERTSVAAAKHAHECETTLADAVAQAWEAQAERERSERDEVASRRVRADLEAALRATEEERDTLRSRLAEAEADLNWTRAAAEQLWADVTSLDEGLDEVRAVVAALNDAMNAKRPQLDRRPVAVADVLA